MNLLRALIVAVVALGSSACVYSNVALPLDTNLDETTLGSKVGESQIQSVLWAVAWGDAGMQAAAKNGGITTLRHADQRSLQVLMGIYARHKTIVYGD